jgi:catechol-2,3-dioxygenase
MAPDSTDNTPLSGPVSGLVELTLEVHDLGAAERFYCDALGLRLLSRAQDRTWLAVGDATRLGLWSPGRKEFGDRGGRHVHFALTVAPRRLDQLARRLRGLGVAVRGPVEHEGGDRSVYFEDPEGNVVEAWDFLERGQGARAGIYAL